MESACVALKMFHEGPPYLCGWNGGPLKVGAMIHGLCHPSQGIHQGLGGYSCSQKNTVPVAWVYWGGRGVWGASPLGSVFLMFG